MTKLLQLQITDTLLAREHNENAAHGNIILRDAIKFQSTISPFHQQNPIPLISSCYNFHIVKLLIQNTSISIKYSNILFNALLNYW